MKTFILLIATATLAFAAVDSITDNMEVIIVDAQGNKTNGGRVIDHLKINKDAVQSKLDAKLAAKADAKPLEARAMVEAAKLQGATVAKATEDKVVAAEAEKAAADLKANEDAAKTRALADPEKLSTELPESLP